MEEKKKKTAAKKAKKPAAKSTKKPAKKKATNKATKSAGKSASNRAGNRIGNRAGKSSRNRPHRKTQAEKISEIDYSEIAKISDIKRLEKMYTTLRQGYVRRKASLEKKFGYSPAVAGIEEYRDVFKGTMRELRKRFDKEYEVLQSTIPNLGNRHDSLYADKLRSEINQYQQFFRNKTSTEEGLRQWKENMDRAAFGTDENGKPKGTMEEDTRKKFWAVYREYMLNHNTKNLPSEQVLKLLRELYNENTNFEVTADMFDRIDAKYIVISNADYIRELFDEYTYQANEKYGKSGEYISEELLVDDIINSIIEHFPLFEGNKKMLYAELKKEYLKGEFGSGGAVYSGARYY